jgi:radical SAM superfamily enzyme YgiQ (UPF0313 family)
VNGKIVRERRIENILDEIEYLLEMHGIREIHIEDDNFTLSKNRVIQFCKEIESRNLDFSWALPNGIKLDTIDREMMRCMEEAGCYSLAVGIESGSPRILLEMNRNTTLEKVREKIEIITRETNIRITGMFILGYANETVKEMNMTIDFACGLPLHRAQFGFFLPLPGTDIYKRMVETAEINYDTLCWDDFRVDRIVYTPPNISRNKLRWVMKKAFWRFYMRKKIILLLLKEIHSIGQLKTIYRRVLDIFGQPG